MSTRNRISKTRLSGSSKIPSGTRQRFHVRCAPKAAPCRHRMVSRRPASLPSAIALPGCHRLEDRQVPHADAGQMNLYLNYAREHWTLAEESPPVGLILCSEQDNAVAHYALEGLRNTVLAREYRLALPDEGRLARQIEETRHRLLER